MSLKPLAQVSNTKNVAERGGWQLNTMISILASYPGFDSQHLTKKFRGKIVDIAEVNQWRCLEEREQWLEIVD